MSDSLHVRFHMERNCLKLKPDQDIREVIQLFNRDNIFGAPVVDDMGNLIGVISGTDCIRAALKSKYDRNWQATVEDYMTTNVETVDADYSVLYVAEMFLKGHYRRYPVVEDNQVIGQISRNDILHAMGKVSDSIA